MINIIFASFANKILFYLIVYIIIVDSISKSWKQNCTAVIKIIIMQILACKLIIKYYLKYQILFNTYKFEPDMVQGQQIILCF